MEESSNAVITIDDVIKETETKNRVFDVEWGNITLHIKERLSLTEMMQFVKVVIDSLFTKDTDEYHPELKDFLISTYILSFYAGIDTDGDISKIYDLVCGSDIIYLIRGYIDTEQFDSICKAIDDKIGILLRTRTGSLNMQMSELLSKFESLEETLSGMFSGVDKDTVSKIADSISNGSFDMDKVVKAYLANKDNKEEDEK